MFIDEKRSGEVQQASLAGFTDFVGTRDPAEEYDWADRTVCACAQYARSIGKYEEWLAPPTDAAYWIWTGLDKLARTPCGVVGTFGKLAEKIEDICLQS